MSAPEIERAPVTETIWQGGEVALTYIAGDPWPYALTMLESAEGFIILDAVELATLRDSIDRHLAQPATPTGRAAVAGAGEANAGRRGAKWSIQRGRAMSK